MELGRLIEIMRCLDDGLCAGCAYYGDNKLTCDECKSKAIEEIIKIIKTHAERKEE